MSVLTIYERAPIGAMIAFRNSVPKPSEEDADALAAWKKCNGTGWLVRCTPPRSSGELYVFSLGFLPRK